MSLTSVDIDPKHRKIAKQLGYSLRQVWYAGFDALTGGRAPVDDPNKLLRKKTTPNILSPEMKPWFVVLRKCANRISGQCTAQKCRKCPDRTIEPQAAG